MKTIIVATDFSPIAQNAAYYAIAYLQQNGGGRLLVYHAYQIPVTPDPITPMVQMADVDTMQQSVEDNMHFFRTQLDNYPQQGISIETFTELNDLSDGLNALAALHQADVIIMGITGVGKLEETLIGSSAVAVARAATTPVWIIPAGVQYKPFKNILFACDLKQIIETTPVQAIQNLVQQSNATLHVVHVSQTTDAYSTNTEHEIKMLNGLLQNLQPEYHFINSDDFVQAINDFADTHAIDLIVSIPKKHGFFEKLFNRSHVKMLAYHTHVPLMEVHEQ
jgi:nucleotide-binding universal stress UspA family protein